MENYVQPVDAELIVKADQRFASDCEAGGTPDIAISAVSELKGKCGDDELMAIILRLIALGFLVISCNDNPWVKKIAGKNKKTVNELLVRASAKATLVRTDNLAEMRFNQNEILAIALGGMATAGRA